MAGVEGFIVRQDLSGGSNTNFPGPGLAVVSAGATPNVTERFVQTVNGGYSAQDQFGINNFVYATVGGRYDFSSAFGENELAVGPGDVCLLYSDGVTEARSPAGELFGEERLRRWLQRQQDLRPSTLVAALRTEVAGFTGHETPTDDLTCVAVRLALEETCPPS